MATVNDTNKLAQSASALGAGLLGFGIGAKWGAGFSHTLLLVVLAIGAVIHVAGMYAMQMKERSKAGRIAKILWITAWLCLLILVGLLIYIIIGKSYTASAAGLSKMPKWSMSMPY